VQSHVQLDATGAVQGTGSFVRPGYGSLTSSFGARADPFTGYVKFHGGADFGIGDGGIYAADRGMVVLAGYNGSYGNVTVVSHGRIGSSSLATLYGHQSRILVTPGDTVEKGQLIGLVGSTGYSTGPHLHFEVRIDGTRVDPVPWLAKRPLPGRVPRRTGEPQAVSAPVPSPTSTALPSATRYSTKGRYERVVTQRSSQAMVAYPTTKAVTVAARVGPGP